MNNQAAQTMPLPEPEVLLHSPTHGHVYGYTTEQMRAYGDAREAAALSQTAGVVHLRTGVPDKDGREICVGDRIVYRNASQYTKEEYWNPEYVVEWKAPSFVLRHVGGGKNDSNASFAFNVAVRNPYWAIKLETIDAAPAASGGEGPVDVDDDAGYLDAVADVLESIGKVIMARVVRVIAAHIRDLAPKPPSAASVSERARELLAEVLDGYDCPIEPENINIDGVIRTDIVLAAIEQALTQQRGEPVAWRYVHVIDGDSGSWQPMENLTPAYRKRLTDDGCEFEFAYAATTPQPSADAVRELVKRWRFSAANLKATGTQIYINEGLGMEFCARELESLLSAASGEKGVG